MKSTYFLRRPSYNLASLRFFCRSAERFATSPLALSQTGEKPGRSGASAPHTQLSGFAHVRRYLDSPLLKELVADFSHVSVFLAKTDFDRLLLSYVGVKGRY